MSPLDRNAAPAGTPLTPGAPAPRPRNAAARDLPTGVGYKPFHFRDLLAGQRVGFLEIHAENYMGAGGAPHNELSRLRELYPLSIHGVSASLGGPDRLDSDHLRRLADLVRRYKPFLVSEHLAWCAHAGSYFNDLLPIPYTNASLVHVCAHVEELQDAVGRRILIENPSTYLSFVQSTWDEVDFLAEIVRRTGCGLLLDINNVFVSSVNQNTAAEDYIARVAPQAVEEIHLAGYAEDTDDVCARLLIDAHDSPVRDSVCSLYGAFLKRSGARPTLIEWDNDVPEFDMLVAQAAKADRIALSFADSCEDQPV